MLSELRRRHLASAHARTRGTSAFGPFLIGSLLLGSSLLVSLDIGSARADCDTADGRVKWLSGIVYTYYEPGEGLNGAVLGAASNGNYLVMPTDVFGARSFEITGPGELDQRSSLSVGYTEDIMADGSLFYLAAPPGLRIISINAQGVLASVGSMSTAYSYGLDKQGDYVYLATGSGLEVIDVSTPSAPAVVGTWNGSIRHVAVAGSRAYVATTSDGVYSIDISVATNPTFVARVITPVVSDVEADAGYLYTSSSNNGFRIYDLTQPDAPAQVGQLSENAQRLVLADGYALLDQSGTKLVDVTDPTQPVLTGAYRGAGFLGATVVDGVAYLAGGLGGLQAVDLGDHTNPAPLTTFPSGASGKDLTTFGSHLAMLQGDLFQIVSLADPINPVNEGSLSMPGVNGFGISGDYAFAVYQGQFHTIDLSNPSSPQVVATIAAPVAVYDLVVTGDRIYYWNDAGISTIVNTIDISDPLAPVLLASEELFFPTAVMAAQGNTVFFGETEFEYHANVWVYDFTDPSNPVEQDFWFSEPLAAMTVADGEVISVGVSQAVARDASSHQVKGSVGRARFAGGIHASESGGIYTWSGSYHAFSGGTSLTYVSTGSTPGGAVQGLTTLGDYLYATDAAALYVYEIPCATSDVPSVPVTVDARGLLAYPNPSSGGTWFSLPAPTVGGSGVSKDAVFEVFGSDGCLIRSVPVELDGSPIRWDGLDDAGRRVPSGTVWVRVQTATSTYSTRVQILR